MEMWLKCMKQYFTRIQLDKLSNMIIKQGPQKLNSLKSLKIQNSPPIPGFSLLWSSEMAFISNFRWQNRKERSNRSTNNGDIDTIAKRIVGE